METLFSVNNHQDALNAVRCLEANDKYFFCDFEIITETEKAICFNKYAGYLDHKKPVWIPKSKCEIVEHADFGRRIFVEKWLYKNFK